MKDERVGEREKEGETICIVPAQQTRTNSVMRD